MKIKYNLGQTVYFYDSSNIIETEIKSFQMKEDGTMSYKLKDVYHNKNENVLFESVEEVLENLKTRVIKPRSVAQDITSKAKNFLNK